MILRTILPAKLNTRTRKVKTMSKKKSKYYKTIPTKELTVAELLANYTDGKTYKCVAAHDESITSQQTVETETAVDTKKETSFQQELLDGLQLKGTVAKEFDSMRRFGFPIGLTVKQQTELVDLVGNSPKLVQTIPDDVRNDLAELFDVEFGKNPAEAKTDNEEKEETEEKETDFSVQILKALPQKDEVTEKQK